MAFRILLLAFAAAIILPAETQCLIRGQVSDSEGAAIGKALISVFPKDSTSLAFRGNANYDDGTFCVDNLTPGIYTVKAWQNGFRASRVHDVVVRRGEAANMGTIQLEVGSCDARGVNCDDFITPPTFPSKHYPIIMEVRADLHLPRECGANLSKGKAVCGDWAKDTDLVFTEEHGALSLRPINGARIDPGCSGGYHDQALPVDGLGKGDDLCVKTTKGYTSHILRRRLRSAGCH